MNKYQKKLHKEVRKIINEELKNNDEQYPKIDVGKNYIRNLKHVLNRLKLESNQHYREIRLKVKKS